MTSRFSCYSYHRKTSFLLVLAIAFAFPTSPAPQTIKDWEWSSKKWGIVLEDLMPMKGRPGYYVTYRATQSLHAWKDEAPEYYFRLGIDIKDSGPGIDDYVSAHVRMADSVSIYDQIGAMRAEGSVSSTKSIESKIKMKSLDYTEKTCPAVGKEFREFQKLRYGPPYTNPDQLEVDLDPPIYEFHVDAARGRLDVTLFDATDTLVVWAMKTQHELEACETERSKQNGNH